jgi:hypothetical protein
MQRGLTEELGMSAVNAVDVALFFKKYEGEEEKGLISLNQFSSALLPFSQEFASLVQKRTDWYSRKRADLREYFTSDTRE